MAQYIAECLKRFGEIVFELHRAAEGSSRLCKPGLLCEYQAEIEMKLWIARD